MVQKDRRQTTITLIGTGHVFDLSSALFRIFDDKLPDVICLELDEQRFAALEHKKREPLASQKPSKNLPFIYQLLARFQQNMAQQYGINAGDEMLAAAEYARTHQIPVELVDMNAQKLFTKMWKTMPFLEKLRLLLSGFGGIAKLKPKVLLLASGIRSTMGEN